MSVDFVNGQIYNVGSNLFLDTTVSIVFGRFTMLFEVSTFFWLTLKICKCYAK